jgi:hypothetical protein
MGLDKDQFSCDSETGGKQELTLERFFNFESESPISLIGFLERTRLFKSLSKSSLQMEEISLSFKIKARKLTREEISFMDLSLFFPALST